MAAAAILVLAGTEAKSDLGRVVNALQIAKELDEAGDEVTIISTERARSGSRHSWVRSTGITTSSSRPGTTWREHAVTALVPTE
jgi:hypothetical protein